MNIEEIREYCLKKKGAEESFPFDSETLVFKVAGKMFALSGIEGRPASINLKCNPEFAIELREKYESVIPGYHMNKQHWNTVETEGGDVSDKLVRQLIDHSYDLIISGLPKIKRERLMKK